MAPFPACGAVGDTHISVLQHHGYRMVLLACFGNLVSKTKLISIATKAQSDHFLVQTLLCLCSDVYTVWEEVTATKLLDGCTYHALESR